MDLERVGFAVLGAGAAAEHHRKAVEANADMGAKLVAIGHYDPARSELLGERFGVSCLDQDDLLARPEVDVVCVCTPSGLHAEQTIAAAEAGKHVLVEKPMALTMEDAQAMIAACEVAGVKLGVVLQRRGETLFSSIRNAIHAGALGKLTLGLVTVPYHRSQDYYDSAAWRGSWKLDGGGVLMNQGIHLVDLLVWYMGDPVKVEAYAGTLDRNIEVEDTLVATLRFENGAVATISATTTIAPGFPHRVEIYGTDGGIQLEGETLVRWQQRESQYRTVAPETDALPAAGSGADPGDISVQGHAAIVEDFISALREDREPLVCGREGLRSLSAVVSIYKAAGLLANNEKLTTEHTGDSVC